MTVNLTSVHGHDRMKEWNPKFKFQHMPMWFRMLVRKYFRNKGIAPNLDYEQETLEQYKEQSGSFWEHSGSLPARQESLMTTRSFITQPYGEIHACNKTARYWADALGCDLKIHTENGVWNRNTLLYEFSERPPLHTYH